jgi:hypothetical protein
VVADMSVSLDRFVAVPVLLGKGIRLLDNLTAAPIELDNPEVIEGNGVTHLYYEVPRSPR